MRLPTEARIRAVNLRSKGWSFGKISNELKKTGVSVTRRSLSKLYKRYRETGSVEYGKRDGKARLHTQAHIDFVNKSMNDVPDMSAKDLREKIREEFGINVSKSAVTRFRRKLGWTLSTTHYNQMIRDTNKVKRLDWCQVQRDNKETFDDVIFTDESKIMMKNISRRSYRMKGQPKKGIPKAKHPYSVMVWGGISKKGATSLVIFTGIMKSEFYQEAILRDTLMPFIREKYPDHHRLMQDNDPKHTSKSTSKFMEDNNINWWRTPPESPDLNPIENLWHELKMYIERVKKPKVKDELIAGIQEFWATVDAEKCQKYINHLDTVIPEVIKCQGGPSGY